MTDGKKRKILPPQEWLSSLPSKRMATQVLFWNLDKQILLVKPNYRKDWLLPGGIVEAGEAPIDGALREIKEELSFTPGFLVFAGIDYNPETAYKDADFLHVFFDGGYMSEEQIATLTKEDAEIDEIRFFSIDELDGFATPQQAIRIREYVKSHRTPVFLSSGKRADAWPGGQSFQYTTVVASVVVENNGTYLMVQEEQAAAHGLWNFPSGRVDACETIEEAAVRETKEEAGLEIELDRKLAVKQLGAHLPVVHTYIAKSFSGEAKAQAGEIMNVGWFSLDEIRAMKPHLRGVEFTLDIIEELENGSI